MQGTQVGSLVQEDPIGPWRNEVHVPQLLRLCSGAHQPQLLELSRMLRLLKPAGPRALALQREKPLQ